MQTEIILAGVMKFFSMVIHLIYLLFIVTSQPEDPKYPETIAFFLVIHQKKNAFLPPGQE